MSYNQDTPLFSAREVEEILRSFGHDLMAELPALVSPETQESPSRRLSKKEVGLEWFDNQVRAGYLPHYSELASHASVNPTTAWRWLQSRNG